jgi:hypothetical protein
MTLVFVDGARHTLRASDVVGEGGEATVFKAGSLAIKLYKSPGSLELGKLQALVALGPRLPREALAPTSVVVDRAGAPVGFAMPLLPRRFEPLALLARRSHWAQTGLGLGAVARLLASLHDVLSTLHRLGVVVGDVSDQNALFSDAPGRRAARASGELSLSLVDTDSWQVAGFSCPVATEAFLDPRLYGPDLAAPVLTARGATRVFDTESDWYAFAVLALRSLAWIHPYGGTLAALPTLARRAAARHSVWSPDVIVPACSRERLLALPDELCHTLSRVFDGGERAPLPRAQLTALEASLVTCSCGLEHARPRCPRCAPGPTHVAMSGSAAATGALDASLHMPTGALERTLLAELGGPVLALVAHGSTLTLVVRDGDALHLRTLGPLAAPSRGARLSPPVVLPARASGLAHLALSHELFAGATRAGELVVSRAGVTARTETIPFQGASPSFAVGRHLYRVARGAVLRGALEADGGLVEEPVAAALEGQTWLAADASGARVDRVLVVTRVLGERTYGLLVGRELRELSVPSLARGATLTAEHATFAEGRLLLTRALERGGVPSYESLLFDDAGRLLAALTEGADRLAGAALTGGALVGATHLLASARGLVRTRLGKVTEVTLVAGPELVAEEAPLAAHGLGLVAASGETVHLLRLA